MRIHPTSKLMMLMQVTSLQCRECVPFVPLGRLTLCSPYDNVYGGWEGRCPNGFVLPPVVGRTATSLASHPLSFNVDIGGFRAFVGPLVSLSITRYVTRKVLLHS